MSTPAEKKAIEDRQAVEKELNEAKLALAEQAIAAKSANEQKLWKETGKFDGTGDWQAYIDQFEFKATCANVDDAETKKRTLLSSVAPEIYTEVFNFMTKPLSQATFDEVVEAMTSMFGKKSKPWHEIREFEKMSMAAGETVFKYFQRLKAAVKHVKFANTDERLKERMVSGLLPEIFDEISDMPRDISLKDAIDRCVSAQLTIESKLTRKTEGMFYVRDGSRSAIPKLPAKNRLGPRPTMPSQGSSGSRWNGQCWRCLGDTHTAMNCFFKNEKCRQCKKIGHIVKACKQARVKKMVDGSLTVEVVNQLDDDAQVSNPCSDPIYLKLILNGVNVEMELDSGSRYNIMNMTTYTKNFRNSPLMPVGNLCLKSFTNGKCEITGRIRLITMYEGVRKNTEWLVVKNGSSCLLGREFTATFGLGLAKKEATVNCVNDHQADIELIFKKYPKLFADKVGRCH